jgi:hypothetical protein
MACLFPQAWGWRSDKSSKQELVEDDELLLQGATIASLPSLLSFSLNLDSITHPSPSKSNEIFSNDVLYATCLDVHHAQLDSCVCSYVRALGLGDRACNRDIIEPAPALRGHMLVHSPFYFTCSFIAESRTPNFSLAGL